MNLVLLIKELQNINSDINLFKIFAGLTLESNKKILICIYASIGFCCFQGGLFGVYQNTGINFSTANKILFCFLSKTQMYIFGCLPMKRKSIIILRSKKKYFTLFQKLKTPTLRFLM